MAVTPLIKPIQNKSGTFYTFQSALEDINITLSNSENGVRFSKFALIRLPQIGVPDDIGVELDNKAQFMAQGETALIEGLNTDQNINLAQSFQNYALNMESLLLSRDDYNREEKLTVSERVFWKWLKETGSIRFKNANELEKNTAVLAGEKRYVEETSASSPYSSVVKYLGDIDVVNSIKSKDNAYTEVYIHIPTSVGSTPHILFKSHEDGNYAPNMVITHIPSDPLDIEYLSGRHYDETHPFGLDLKAHYDLDDASVTTTIDGDERNWFNSNVKNSYYTDEVFDSAVTERISKDDGNGIVINYRRSTLDGIMLDFDLANYKLASENPNIKSFSQFNDYVGNKDFQFNAILIYYDVFDPNNLDSNGNPIDYKRNLYGVLFLNKIEQSGLEFSIPYITKYMPDPLNKINGTSFSFKANLKLDTSIENVLVEKSINDYSTFSMDLFIDVLSEFRQIQTKMNDKLIEIEQIKQSMVDVTGLLINTEDINELNIRMANMEKSVNESQALFSNTGTIIRMIDNVNEKVNDIISGDTNVNITYDSSILRPGDGINLDRRTPNRVLINSKNQKYNISNDSIVNIFSNSTVPLSKFSNYVRHENNGDDIVLERDLDIYINDSIVKWKKGQTFRLIFDDKMILDIFNISIKTDFSNIRQSGSLNYTIGILNDADFDLSNDRPIFDITCIDEETLEFRIDKIR